MNLHPILVHFPIALLTVYAVIEIARVPAVTKQSWWFPMKAGFAILGALAAVPTFFTGWIQEQGIDGEVPKLLDVHGDFALYTLLCFALLAAAHVVVILKAQAPARLVRAAAFILRPAVAVPLAVLGLVFVTVTGALGGTMIYGPDIDPAARVIYDILIGE